MGCNTSSTVQAQVQELRDSDALPTLLPAPQTAKIPSQAKSAEIDVDIDGPPKTMVCCWAPGHGQPSEYKDLTEGAELAHAEEASTCPGAASEVRSDEASPELEGAPGVTTCCWASNSKEYIMENRQDTPLSRDPLQTDLVSTEPSEALAALIPQGLPESRTSSAAWWSAWTRPVTEAADSGAIGGDKTRELPDEAATTEEARAANRDASEAAARAAPAWWVGFAQSWGAQSAALAGAGAEPAEADEASAATEEAGVAHAGEPDAEVQTAPAWWLGFAQSWGAQSAALAGAAAERSEIAPAAATEDTAKATEEAEPTGLGSKTWWERAWGRARAGQSQRDVAEAVGPSAEPDGTASEIELQADEAIRRVRDFVARSKDSAGEATGTVLDVAQPKADKICCL